VAERFFSAFQRALPHLPREELGWRLHFAIGALSGVLAGADTDNLIAEFSKGQAISDLHLIARLASLMVAALKAPLPDGTQLAAFAAVLGDAGDSGDVAEGITACGPLDAHEQADAKVGTQAPQADAQTEQDASALAAASALQAAAAANAAQSQEGLRPAGYGAPG
jgi:hypothetical protein